MTHRKVERKSLATGAQFGKRLLIVIHGCHHRRKRAGEPQLRKRRVDHAPLLSPFVATRHEHRVAHQRLQRTHHQVVLGIDLGAVGQNCAHQLRFVNDQYLPARIAEMAHRHAVRGRRQQAQQITVALNEHAQQRNDWGQGGGAGWNVFRKVWHRRRRLGSKGSCFSLA